MTEQEAKTKWCPMMRSSTGVFDKHREPANNDCIGSGCMMWRWDEWAEGGRVEDKHGHCGLAGPTVKPI